MERLRIHLLGGFSLERDGVRLPPIASLRGRSFFAYLAMQRGRPIQRDLLAGVFWPDLPESKARKRLSHTLWQIQDVVNDDSTSFLKADAHTLAFDTSSPYWLDVDAFDDAIDAAENEPDAQATHLRHCVDLYRGDFLAGHFDDWVIVEQEIYRQRFLTVLRHLVDATKSSGAYDEALDFAVRLTHHDQLNEEAHREVMRLNVLLGRTTQAVEQFERLRSVLTEELDAHPANATVELYDKILRQRRSGIHPPLTSKPAMLLGGSTESPFVGRDDERRQVVEAMDRVLGGKGGVVLVEGEPGVGKTRLAFELADDAKWRGFEVSWGACSQGAVRPFAPLVEVLGSLNPLRVEQLSETIEPVWLGEAGRLAETIERRNPTTTASELKPAEASERMIEALVRTLESLGRISPHLIIIDDVHWADRDTLSVLKRAASRLARSRVLLILIYRSEEARGDSEVWGTLRELDKSAGLGRAVLAPLSVFELDNMVRRIVGASRLRPAVAASLHRETGGNVLFTIETLLAMRDRGLFEPNVDPVLVLENHVEEREVEVAPRVRSIIESRLALLSEEVASVFELVALIGHRITIEMLEVVTDLHKDAVLRSIDELLFRGLIRDEGDGHYQIAHDQIRQVVSKATDAQRAIDLHQRVAAALETLDPDHVEAIGHHYREGGLDAEATSYLYAAGLRAIEFSAYSTARHHLSAAAETAVRSNLSPEARYELLGRLEDVLNVLGRREEQHDVIKELRELADTDRKRLGDVTRRLAWLRAQESDFASAEAEAQRAVDIESAHRNDEAIAQSLVAVGTIRRWSGRPLEAVEPLKAAAASPASANRVEAMTELASTLVELQRIPEALDCIAEVSTILEATGNLQAQAEVAGIEGRAFRIRGDKDRAVERYETAIELCRRIGYRHGEGLNRTNLANLHQLMGGVSSALVEYDRAAHIFSDLGNMRGEAMVLANSASARHNLLGDDERAKSDATRAMAYFEEFGDRARHAQCLEIVAGAEARSGNHHTARELLEESLEELKGVGNAALEAQHLRSLALLALEDDQIDEADRIVEQGLDLSIEHGLTAMAIELRSIKAMTLLASGDNRRSFEMALSAIQARSEGVERPYLLHHRLSLAAEAHDQCEVARTAAVAAGENLHSTLEGLDSEAIEQAIQTVPEHRSIVERAELFAPRTVEVRLPSATAPTGRSPTDEEMLTVLWTVQHPEDDRVTHNVERRRGRVLRLLREAEERGAVPSTRALALSLGVSQTTIRRDLSALRDAGHPARTRGDTSAAS